MSATDTHTDTGPGSTPTPDQHNTPPMPNPIETRFEEEGSLEKPKIVGRLVRFAIGALLVFQAYPLVVNFGRALEVGLSLESNIIAIVILFLVLPYVINIGWKLNTKRLSQFVVIGVSLLLGAIDYFSQGAFYGQWLKAFTVLWILYAAVHLGVSFLLSAILATPGCEMRAIPHLWSRLTGRRTDEHYCPGPFDRLDRWERGRDSTSEMQK